MGLIVPPHHLARHCFDFPDGARLVIFRTRGLCHRCNRIHDEFHVWGQLFTGSKLDRRLHAFIRDGNIARAAKILRVTLEWRFRRLAQGNPPLPTWRGWDEGEAWWAEIIYSEPRTDLPKISFDRT